MHSLCSGHSAPVISGVSVGSNPPRRKTNGNQGSSSLAALSPPASRRQRDLRPMAVCADRAYAFDRSSNGRCALAASAGAWRGVIPAQAQALVPDEDKTQSGYVVSTQTGHGRSRHFLSLSNSRLMFAVIANIASENSRISASPAPGPITRNFSVQIVNVA